MSQAAPNPAIEDQTPLQTVESTASDAQAQLAAVGDLDALEQFRIAFLGSKGKLKALMKLLGKADPADRKTLGQAVNKLQKDVTAAFEAKKADLESGAAASADAIDVTEPGKRPNLGARHPVWQTVDDLTDLFGRMGFAVAAGPELEDEFHNFAALNIPASHPARDPLDNFYLADAGEGENLSLLRTQTSTVQIRVMQQQKPPLRVVIPGRVYRPDTHDDTHLSMFHQLEALVVDENITMVDLKS
ncbi:MAG: phenylalanine--tRNA ligase subunit alpha, partial [Planctomycetota bacterium]